MNRLQGYFVVTLLAVFTACSSLEPSPTTGGALVGAGVGAGAGAIVGNQSGNPQTGAAIGAGVGALTGAAAVAIAENGKARNYEETVAEQQEIIRRQQEEIKRQDGEIEDLKRQQYHNESLRRFESK